MADLLLALRDIVQLLTRRSGDVLVVDTGDGYGGSYGGGYLGGY